VLLAAEGGWLETLQWALAAGCPASPQLAVAAVQHQHAHVLRWLVDGLRRPWDEDADAICCQAAARAGDLATLQYLRSKGCLRDVATCTAAAAGGHLPVLQWARSTGAAWGAATCSAAAEGATCACCGGCESSTRRARGTRRPLRPPGLGALGS
jgi:hypothetical protein